MGDTRFSFLLAITHVSLLLSSVIAVNSKKGFTMKMIHRDSKESPLYPGDHLTRDERLQRLVEQSIAQARYIRSQIILQSNATRSMNLDVVRMPVQYETSRFYVAMVGLGTFPGKQTPFMNYYLMIDSGSDQTWLQCEGATKTFKQDMPLYPWNLSTTYQPVPCYMHPHCKGDNCNDNGTCTYLSAYMSGSFTYGNIAKEKFTLGSNTGALESIELQMGCGLRQENFDKFFGRSHTVGKPDVIAGILGLGSGQGSFVNQLGDSGQGKFSYCFETFNFNITGSDTYLKFGEDATIGGIGQIVHTTLIVVPDYQTSIYYLNLKDISVGPKRVRFPENTFELQSNGEGGTIIDSGNPISSIYKEHFDRVAELVKEHFAKLGIEYIGSQYNFNVCFRRPRGRFDITNYPSITLHFQHADYVIQDYKANFLITSAGDICLGFFRQDTNRPAFTLGAMQQANKRILYNVRDRALSFTTEHCQLGS